MQIIVSVPYVVNQNGLNFRNDIVNRELVNHACHTHTERKKII